MLSVIAAPPTFLDDQVGPRYPPAGKAFVRTGIFGWNFPGHASGVGGPDRGQGRGYRLGSPPAPADREDRGAPTGLTVGLPILGPGLTMGVGRLSTEVTMAIEREMDGAYLRLAEAAAAMRYRQRDLRGGGGGGEAVRARDRADRRVSVGAGGFRRPGLGGLPARPAGAAA